MSRDEIERDPMKIELRSARHRRRFLDAANPTAADFSNWATIASGQKNSGNRWNDHRFLFPPHRAKADAIALSLRCPGPSLESGAAVVRTARLERERALVAAWGTTRLSRAPAFGVHSAPRDLRSPSTARTRSKPIGVPAKSCGRKSDSTSNLCRCMNPRALQILPTP